MRYFFSSFSKATKIILLRYRLGHDPDLRSASEFAQSHSHFSLPFCFVPSSHGGCLIRCPGYRLDLRLHLEEGPMKDTNSLNSSLLLLCANCIDIKLQISLSHIDNPLPLLFIQLLFSVFFICNLVVYVQGKSSSISVVLKCIFTIFI